MHVSHYLLLGFFSGPAAEPEPEAPAATMWAADDGAASDFDAYVQASNAAAIQFMMLAALAIEELH